MELAQLERLVIDALEDLKASDIVKIDVSKFTSVTDIMIVCSGHSTQHVRSIAENLVTKAKHSGMQPLGTEGKEGGEWVLVDLNYIIVHAMVPETREFYDVEGLWQSLDNIKTRS